MPASPTGPMSRPAILAFRTAGSPRSRRPCPHVRRDLRCRRAARLRRADRDAYPSRQVAHRRPLPPPDGRRVNPVTMTAPLKKDFTVEDVYRRAEATLRECLVNGTTRMRTQLEIDPAVELRSFEAVRDAGGRVQMGDRPRNLRLSAGRDDQLSRHRGAARRGIEAGCAGARRGAALRQRPGGADRSRLRAGRANSMSISTCISMSATTPGRCTSTRCSTSPSATNAAAGSSPGTWPSCRCCRRQRLRRWRGVSPMPGSPSPY